MLDDDGRHFNAKVEVIGPKVVLHSRSGTSRNRDYRSALELILSRLDAADLSYEIFLDSGTVQNVPVRDRRIATDPQLPIPKRFDELVRAMNAGSRSHGAWRRLMLIVEDTNEPELCALLRVVEDELPLNRLRSSELQKVTTENVNRAVQKLIGGADAPNFAPSRDYDALTDDGLRFAPKKVFGLAIEEALGIEALPEHFSAGWGTICFRRLEEAGLWIVPKHANSQRRPTGQRSPVEKTTGLLNFIPTDEERAWIEGNPKIVTHLIRERQPGLAKQKRIEFIAEHGRLFCEDCGMDPVHIYGTEAGSACIEIHHHRKHVAEMQPGHLTATADLKCLCANCHRVLHRKLTLGLVN
jgi:5-methylcytosine-specific restriction protein A